MRTYLEVNDRIVAGTLSQEDVNYNLLERMTKLQKTHRNIAELDREFIMNA